MDAEKYNRSIELMCSTCGGKQFREAEGDGHPESTIQCALCGRTMSKDELIRENGETVEAAVGEVTPVFVEDAMAELKKRLQDTFKGSKYLRIE
jgi:hypothetical protein